VPVVFSAGTLYAVHMSILDLQQEQHSRDTAARMAVLRDAPRRMLGNPSAPDYSVGFRLLCWAADRIAPAVFVGGILWELSRLAS
jgi:hypothetical protein